LSWRCGKRNAAENLQPGEVLLVENLRFIQKKKLRCCFAKELASLGDIYVNDALELRIVHNATTIIAQFFRKQMFWLTSC
jgi:phosphoglycerate kinase